MKRREAIGGVTIAVIGFVLALSVGIAATAKGGVFSRGRTLPVLPAVTEAVHGRARDQQDEADDDQGARRGRGLAVGGLQARRALHRRRPYRGDRAAAHARKAVAAAARSHGGRIRQGIST